MNTKLAAVAVGTALLVAPAAALAASTPGTVNQQISLMPGSAYSRATGSAQYQAQPGQREFQVEVERLTSLRGSSVLVRVDGALVGSMKVSSKGIAQLTRNSELGQRVPAMMMHGSTMHGSSVTVSTKAGVVIASGTF